MNLQAIWTLFPETFKQWSEDKASRLAAALAYYTIFSIAPLLIIVIAIAGAVFGEEAARGEIVRQIEDLLDVLINTLLCQMANVNNLNQFCALIGSKLQPLEGWLLMV
ncbi:hypothetical protein A2T98_06550 [Nodularia spumigena CENA596]|uniref:Uncharacterized protein n=1 Tax=Nodularia spumigena CENA596 TaxID=1819295 RepID=A0A166K5Z5_NODSP|nr:YhjD/YihY/BrkB family envelope integrity protein [Nodularia spumigena]KZL50620.1 hypothetical protein A2T98_06550 [Nodularia spumigena CENA596]